MGRIRCLSELLKVQKSDRDRIAHYAYGCQTPIIDRFFQYNYECYQVFLFDDWALMYLNPCL
jgi:hypothetical protein